MPLGLATCVADITLCHRLLSRPRLTTIVGLALPIIGGMMSQNVLNLVDILMVGVLGDTALAAVGIASFVQFMCTALIMGIGAGVQAISARRVGEGRSKEAAAPLNAGLLVAVGLGLPMTLGLYLLAPLGFPFIAGDAEVANIGIPYLQMRVLSVVALAMNFSFRGYWNGIGLSKVYFRTIVLMHALNILLNYLLIFGKFGFPELGAVGAGLASSIAFFAGAVLYVVQAFSLARKHGFLASVPTQAELRAMLRLSLPTGVQQTFFAAGMTLLFAIISRVGTAEVAASNVVMNLLLVVILPSIGFGMASATLVGQALGRGDPMEARRWGGDVAKVAFVVMLGAGLFAAAAPHLLLKPFLHDEATLALARGPLRLVALSLPFDAIGLVLVQALIGAGNSRRVMVITVGLQWLFQLPLISYVAFVLDQGLLAIWASYVLSRIAQTLALVLEWRREGWTRLVV